MAFVGVAVIATWSRITSFYESARGTISELQTVRTAIQTRYEIPVVAVFSKRHSAVPGRIRSIELVNAPYARGLRPD